MAGFYEVCLRGLCGFWVCVVEVVFVFCFFVGGVVCCCVVFGFWVYEYCLGCFFGLVLGVMGGTVVWLGCLGGFWFTCVGFVWFLGLVFGCCLGFFTCVGFCDGLSRRGGLYGGYGGDELAVIGDFWVKV